MATRLYLTNGAATYTPPTIRGGWNNATNTGASKLAKSKAGSAVAATRAETVNTNNYKALLRRFVSDPLQNAGTFGGNMTLTQTYYETSASANMTVTVHAYITVGSTDVVRGVVRATVAGGTEFSPPGANGALIPTATSVSMTLSNVAVQVGDRLVIEIGYNAANTSTTSYTGALYYGGTSIDLVAGQFGNVGASRPSWVEFDAVDTLLGAPVRGSFTPVVTTTSPSASGATSRKVAPANLVTTTTGPASSLTQAVRKFTATTTTGPTSSSTASRATSTLITTIPTIQLPATAFRTSEPQQVDTVPSIQLIPLAHIEGDIDLPPPDVEVLSAFYVPARRQGLRFIAQDIFTGTYLDWDLPINDPEITWTLSGPTVIRGNLAPEIPYIRVLGLTPWGTWIHVEEDGLIRASGILQPNQVSAGETVSVEAVGVADYAKDQIWLGNLSEIQIDPLDVVRRIWTHIQSYRDGNVGVTLAATTTPVRLGEPEHQAVNQDTGALEYDEERIDPGTDEDGNPVEIDLEPGRYTDPEGNLYEVREDEDGTRTLYKLTPRMVEAKPYELKYWNLTNCGEEIDRLAKDTPFDYVEASRWNADKTAVEHYIDFGYPRLGALRTDLRFAQDENLTEAVPLAETPDWYASGVVLRGAGEGQRAVTAYSFGYHPTRVRRIVAVTDKTVVDGTRGLALSQEELRRRQSVLTIGTIVISDSHTNAPLGSYTVGDDIVVQAEVPWHGETALKHRITAYTWRPDKGEVTATLRRSEQFAYGRPGA